MAGETGSTSPGQRRFNWVWYRNAEEHVVLPTLLLGRDGRVGATGLPPGKLGLHAERELRDAAIRILPPPYAELVAATAQPFVQGIFDLAVPKMALRRVALLGDAAFIPRPHTAASTAKAAANAIALAEVLEAAPGNVVRALTIWEPPQLELGAHLFERGRLLGDRSQFPAGRKTYPADVRYGP